MAATCRRALHDATSIAPHVPTAMLYGRVVEHVNISVDELQRVLARLTGKGL